MRTEEFEVVEHSTITIACPDWCQGTAREHKFELDNGYPVEHFAHMRNVPEPACAVSLTESVDPDGSRSLKISVEDDDYSIELAEHTALKMLEAVKVARS